MVDRAPAEQQIKVWVRLATLGVYYGSTWHSNPAAPGYYDKGYLVVFPDLERSWVPVRCLEKQETDA